MLSYYCSSTGMRYGIKVNGVSKLVPNLGEKSKYVLHYKKLKLHLPLRIKLPKVPRILKFKQSDCLKKYIDFNTIKKKKKCCQYFWKRLFLNWWILVLLVKQWEIYEKE